MVCVIWAVIIGLVLMIPILAIVLDSPVGQAMAARISGADREDGDPELGSRIDQIEAEMKYLGESVESLREEAEFVRRLIEGSDDDEPSRIGPGE